MYFITDCAQQAAKFMFLGCIVSFRKSEQEKVCNAKLNWCLIDGETPVKTFTEGNPVFKVEVADSKYEHIISEYGVFYIEPTLNPHLRLE